MAHKPKTLALLISLIGVGMSSGTQAGTAPEEPALTALDVTRWSPGLVWRSEELPADLPPATVALRRAVEENRADDGAVRAPTEVGPGGPWWPAPTVDPGPMDTGVQDEPGTALVHPGSRVEAAAAAIAGDTRAPAADPGLTNTGVPDEPGTALVHPGSRVEAAAAVAGDSRTGLVDQPRRLATLTKALGARYKAAKSASLAAIDRLGPLQAALVTRALSGLPLSLPFDPRAKPCVPPAAKVRFAPCASEVQPVDPVSIHTDWLVENLTRIWPEGMSATSRERVLSRVTERFPAAVAMPSPVDPALVHEVAQRHASQLSARRSIVVATQSEKVLRNLDAILNQERGAVGVVAEPEEMIVATQAEKVLATLLEVSTARRADHVHAKRTAHRLRERAVATLPSDMAIVVSAPAPAALIRAEHEAIALDIDLSLAALPAPAPVARQSEPSNPFGSHQLAVADGSLDRVRGGFITNGLNISFGIERAVYVNGALVTSTSLNVSDLGHITAGRGTVSLDSATLALIQSGAGNLVSTGSISPTGIGTVVQNTIDGQNIRNLTVINATVNSLGVLRGLNLQSSMRGAVIDSLRR